MAESADPLGDLIHGLGELGVLRLEHEMQRVEHGPGDVPMIIVGLQIERVAVGQEAGETVGDGSAAAVVDSNVNGHGVGLSASLRTRWRTTTANRTIANSLQRGATLI